MGTHAKPFILKPIEVNRKITIGSMCCHNRFLELQIGKHRNVYLVVIASNQIVDPNLKRIRHLHKIFIHSWYVGCGIFIRVMFVQTIL
jgi:hypothetical protein